MWIHQNRRDGLLVRQVLGGNREKFGELVDRYLNDAYALARAYLANRTDAEDAVQDSFLKAYSSLDSLRDTGKFCPWLLAIVRNTCMRYLTLRKRERTGLDDASIESAASPDVERRDLHALLRTHVGDLDPSLREVVLLHYFRGLSTAEIAQRLDIKRDAVKKRLQRARETLGTALLQELGESFQAEAPSKKDKMSIMGMVLATPVAWQPANIAGTTWTGASIAKNGALAMVKTIALPALVVSGILALAYLISQRDTSLSAAQSAPAAVKVDAQPDTPAPAQTAVSAIAPEPAEAASMSPGEAIATPLGPEGRVVDEAGLPVGGAEVLLFHNMNRTGLDDAVVERTSTDADGRYAMSAGLEFARRIPHVYAQDQFYVFALHPDFALGWTTVDQDTPQETYDIVVSKRTSGAITVVDGEGNALEGAHVWLCGAGDGESAHPLFRHSFGTQIDVGLISAFTDKAGKVTFENLPDTRCAFVADKPGYAPSWSPTCNRKMVLTKGASVSGRVLTASGIPVPNALVRCDAGWMHDPHLTRADSLGQYAFTDLPANGWDMSVWGSGTTGDGKYRVFVKDETHTMPAEYIQLEPGDKLENFDLTLLQGTIVHCSVVWPDTGTPVAGARIFGVNLEERIEGYTDTAGVFTFTAMAGQVRVRVQSPPDGVYVASERESGETLEFVASGPEMSVVLTAPPIGGKLIPAHGAVEKGEFAFRDVTLYVSAGRYDTATSTGYTPPSVQVNSEDGTFDLANVPAGRTLILYALTSNLAYAGISEHAIPAESTEFSGLTISLQPASTGAVVLNDGAGNPHADIEVVVEPLIQEVEVVFARRTFRTDAEGCVEMDGLIPGLTYHFFNWDLKDESTGRLLIDTSLVVVPKE